MVARKPLIGTVAANGLKYGTGGINIDATRIGTDSTRRVVGAGKGWTIDTSNHVTAAGEYGSEAGRWPANLIHDGSEEVVSLFPETTSPSTYVRAADSGNRHSYAPGIGEMAGKESLNFGDSGSAARFFYCAKASREDREEGLSNLPMRTAGALNMRTDEHSVRNGMNTAPARNHHPTVKPTALMRYLCRLVTPPQGLILDPFMGSGSTGKAAILEGFRFIGIELEAEYIPIAEARLAWAAAQPRQEVLAL